VIGVRAWTHDRHRFPLPPGHRFPIAKYGLLRARLEGVLPIEHAGPASWEALALVHDREHLRRIRCGELGVREQRVLGLPWSPELVERGRRSSQATVEAARDALRPGGPGFGINLGGGTHHAGFSTARGYCLFNDVVLARRTFPALRWLVVDCDVHQGDGTAELLADDEGAFTLSVHGGANYPFRRAVSDLDVDLPSGTGDGAYLTALYDALRVAMPAARPDVVVYLAGADAWEGDTLGRLAVTKAGLRDRDRLVLDATAAAGAALVLTLAGGYAPDVADTVEINEAAVRAVLERAGAPV
jgi:acetoin utilization deacetylase AcuC-like enzyme